MAHKVQNDGSVVFTTDKELKNGQLVKLEDLVGVASTDFKKDQVAVVYVQGAFLVDVKESTALKVGQRLYYDAATGKATTAKTNNTPVGFVLTATAGGADQKAEVLLRHG